MICENCGKTIAYGSVYAASAAKKPMRSRRVQSRRIRCIGLLSRQYVLFKESKKGTDGVRTKKLTKKAGRVIVDK